MTEKIRLVSFDAHQTLITPKASIGSTYAQVAANYGHRRDAVALDSRFPVAFQQTKDEWSVPYGANDVDARRFWMRVVERTFMNPIPMEVSRACYDIFGTPTCWEVLPGVQETLEAIHAEGIPMAVVSNFDVRLAPLLQALKLGPFSQVVVSATIGEAKPSGKLIQVACQSIGCTPQQVLHIGDSEREDGGMCKAVGAQFMYVPSNTGLNREQVLARLRA